MRQNVFPVDVSWQRWIPKTLFGKKQKALSQMDDNALITQCIEGQEQAFAVLFERHKDRVYTLALRFTRDPNDAADVLQEVFLRVHRHIHTFRQEAAFSTWLYRLTLNTSRTFLTRREKRQHREQPHEEGWEERSPGRTSPLPDPAAKKQILQVLNELPDGYRDVLILHDIEGLPHKEIAAIMDITVGTSKSQLYKARRKMREALKELQS
jgi:RNA polymerase sigma-70 factor (ECF subfamily)